METDGERVTVEGSNGQERVTDIIEFRKRGETESNRLAREKTG